MNTTPTAWRRYFSKSFCTESEAKTHLQNQQSDKNQSDAYNTVLIDKNAWPGASGSPIYLSNGEDVIGMLERTGTGDATGISFAVAGERLFNILTSARANWDKEANKQPEEQ